MGGGLIAKVRRKNKAVGREGRRRSRRHELRGPHFDEAPHKDGEQSSRKPSSTPGTGARSMLSFRSHHILSPRSIGDPSLD